MIFFYRTRWFWMNSAWLTMRLGVIIPFTALLMYLGNCILLGVCVWIVGFYYCLLDYFCLFCFLFCLGILFALIFSQSCWCSVHSFLVKLWIVNVFLHILLLALRIPSELRGLFDLCFCLLFLFSGSFCSACVGLLCKLFFFFSSAFTCPMLYHDYIEVLMFIFWFCHYV